ncbi:MAG: hypothetical protein [Malazfec virus 1]
MLVLAMKEEKIVHVSDAIKGTDYICPDCSEVVRCRKGEVNAHHYYHLNSECTSNGESVVHRYFKEKFANLTTINIDGVDYTATQSFVEKTITPNLRVDVLLILNGWKPLVIEVCYKNKKTDTHKEMFAELGLEAYEVYVGLNEDETDFEVTGYETLYSPSELLSKSNELLSKSLELEQQVSELKEELKEYEAMKSKYEGFYMREERLKRKLSSLEMDNSQLKQELSIKSRIANRGTVASKEEADSYKKGSDSIKSKVERVTGLTFDEFSLSFEYEDSTYYGIDIAYTLDAMIKKHGIDSFKIRQEGGLKVTLLGLSKGEIVETLKFTNCANTFALGRVIEKSYNVPVQVQKRGVLGRRAIM